MSSSNLARSSVLGAASVDSTSSLPSRLSALMTSTPAGSSAPSGTSYPFNIPSTSTSNSKRNSAASSILERPINKTKGSEVSLAAWAFMFSEIIQYTQRRVSGIAEFEKKLSILGYHVGRRLLYLLPLRDSLSTSTTAQIRSVGPPRPIRLLPVLTYVHTNLFRALFGRPADALEKSTENEDEYMIVDNDPVLGRSVEVPKEMSQLCTGALLAGIVEAVMDGWGFPSRVTAHTVATEPHPRRCVLLIKLDKSVMDREDALGVAK